MPDLGTTVGLGVTAFLAKDGVNKLLGPTAEYLGGELRDATKAGVELTKRRIEAVGKTFKNASDKLGDRVEQPGTVPPRVLKEVINEGSFYTENINVEYMGGILASSRTPQGRDDRGARMAKLVDSLSTYQLRTHYLVYGSIKHLFAAHNAKSNTDGDRSMMRIYAPLQEYANAMEFTPAEFDSGTILDHIFSGLHDENLIEGVWTYGSADHMKQHFANATEAGFVCAPSIAWAELFLWTFGWGQSSSNFIFSDAFSARVEGLPPYLPGARPTRPPPARPSQETTTS